MLWVPSWSSTSCDLDIFVDQPAEPIATSVGTRPARPDIGGGVARGTRTEESLVTLIVSSAVDLRPRLESSVSPRAERLSAEPAQGLVGAGVPGTALAHQEHCLFARFQLG